jgi:hypothetical protein
MDNDEGRSQMAHPGDQSPEQQLYTISGELERLVWRLTLQAASQQFSPDLFRVLQLATVVELPPNVYIQSIRIASYKPLDRYLHVWCLAPTQGENGEEAWEERTLLRFHTPAFPDPQFTQHRPGMDLNLAWWETVRERLQALTGEMQNASGASASGALSAQATWQGVGDEPYRTPARREQLQAVAGRAGQRLQHAPSALAPTEQLFQDYLLLREQAFEQRDTVYRQLKEAYFAAHPAERATAKHVSEEEVANTIRAWVAQGCSVPSIAPSSSQADQADQRENAQMALEERAPWPLALELERLQTAAQERSRTLERLCEAQPGGHQIETARDASGVPRTICSRCGASLSNRAPDAREGWLLR